MHATELERVDASAAVRLIVDMLDAVVALLRGAVDLQFHEEVGQTIGTFGL